MCRSSSKRCALIGTLALASILAVTVSDVSADKSDPPNPDWYFWNEVTGETQWEDPGDVPYENADASRRAPFNLQVQTTSSPGASGSTLYAHSGKGGASCHKKVERSVHKPHGGKYVPIGSL